jgi:hypothetical protein
MTGKNSAKSRDAERTATRISACDISFHDLSHRRDARSNVIERAMGLFETLRHRNRCMLLKTRKALTSALVARPAFRRDLKFPDRRPAEDGVDRQAGAGIAAIGPLASFMTMSSGGDLNGGRCQRKRSKTPSPG